MILSHADVGKAEADREKINHFLRKFILFFVSLFVTLFHFLKSDVTVAFILPITYDQLAACFTGFVSANRIGKLKLCDAEVFEQLPYIYNLRESGGFARLIRSVRVQLLR